MIALAERAETYIRNESRKRSQRGGNTMSNLENRPSKQRRINEAKQKYVGD